MRKQTDRTLRLWGEAAKTLTTAEYESLSALVDRLAHDDVIAGDALPHAAIAVARGVAEGPAAWVAVKSARSDAARKRKTATDVLDSGALSLDRMTDPATGEAAPIAERPRDPFVSWEDVRGALPARGRTMLDAVAADILTKDRRTGRARREAPSALYSEQGQAEAVNLTGSSATGRYVPATDTGRTVSVLSAPGAYASLDARRPLRPTVLAASVGEPRPRKRADSDALRVEACTAWALASVLMYPGPETVKGRAKRAFLYVTQPQRTGSGIGSIPWMTDIQKASMRKAANHNGMTLAAFCGNGDVFVAPGDLGATGPVASLRYRPVTRTDWARSPRVVDAVGEGIAYGVGSVGLPDRIGLNSERVSVPVLDGDGAPVLDPNGVPVTEWVTVLTARGAKTLAVAVEADRVAGDAAGIVPVSAINRWTPGALRLDSWTTGIGRADGERVPGVTERGTFGAYVSANPAARGAVGSQARRRPLTPCTAPLVDVDGTGARCTCGSKRGALMTDPGRADGAPVVWFHRPRRNG